MLARLERIAGLCRRGEEAVATALVIAIAVVLNLQVLCRYLVGMPLIWPEEMSRLGLVWLTYVAAAAVTARGGHIAVDMLVTRLAGVPRRMLRSAIELVLAVSFATIAVLGWKLAATLGGMEMAVSELPMAWLVAPLFVGGALSAGHALLRAALVWRDGSPVAP